MRIQAIGLLAVAITAHLETFTEAAPASLPPPLPLSATCPPGWEEFEAHCYVFSGKSHTLSWANAEQNCNQRGGHLASIHSRAEQLFIFSISTEYTWLGASDITTEVC